MLCPECKKPETQVLDSRGEERFVRRRRACLGCGYRFTTYERIESPRIRIKKRSGTLEDYQREKLGRGVHLALEKRPFSLNQIEAIIDDIEHRITKSKAREITSKQVGEIVIKKLKEVDEVAYLRFLSVYKSFGSALKFQKEAEKLQRDKN